MVWYTQFILRYISCSRSGISRSTQESNCGPRDLVGKYELQKFVVLSLTDYRMSAGNLCLVTFLSLRNTPLAFLTAYSYERLNILHRLSGYTLVVTGLMHGVTYLRAFQVKGQLGQISDDNHRRGDVMGITAGLSFLIIAVTSLLLRKLRYEVFYIIHIVFFMLVIIGVSFHRPVSVKLIWLPVCAGSMWFCDRAIRTGRTLWFTYRNSASVTPLPHGGVRIVLARNPRRARPGTHLFLWIPKVRLFETHPFTITSTDPLELVISAHDGFTKDLFNYASKHPDTRLRASMDGPYGTLPNFAEYINVVLIAGGSGASFTFGIAVDLLSTLSPESGSRINFVWVVREKGMC